MLSNIPCTFWVSIVAKGRTPSPRNERGQPQPQTPPLRACRVGDVARIIGSSEPAAKQLLLRGRDALRLRLNSAVEALLTQDSS